MASARRTGLQFAFLLLLLISSTQANAVVGALDVNNDFPFVVQLHTKFRGGRSSLCSAAVSRAGLISTAAHCIWKPGAGLAEEVIIDYSDADGRRRKVRERKIFYPKAFEKEMTNWQSAIDGRIPPGWDVKQTQKLDIAFIVPDEFVEVEGFPHWGTELLESQQCFISADELEKYGDTPPPRCAGKLSPAKFNHEIGDLRSVAALAIGYGDFDCRSFDDRAYLPESGCKSDGRRRFAQIPLKPESDGVIPPDLWCTGQVEKHGQLINPVQRGDSGGPRFIRALDGRWLFVGYTSGGDNSNECASSIFANLDLWRAAAVYMSHVAYKPNGAFAWNKNQMRRLFNEILESWSRPNAQALRRLPSFYPVNDTFTETYLAIKKAFATKWPVRHFAVPPGSEAKVTEDPIGEPINTIDADVSWNIMSVDGVKRSGMTHLQLVVRYNYDNEVKLAYGSVDAGPVVIIKEFCNAVSGDALPPEMACMK